MIYLALGLAAALALSIWYNLRQRKENATLEVRLANMRQNLNAKQEQLDLLANARPGDGVDALGTDGF